MNRKERAREILVKLKQKYPKAETPLKHESAFQLLIATILSAQCTDARVNTITPALFKKYPTAEKMSEADIEDIKRIIKPCGFYNSKAVNILKTSQKIVDEHNGEVPDSMQELIKLNGVARKTANVILGEWFNKPVGIAVDTHVIRLSKLLGLTDSSDPKKIEHDLMEIVPKEEWRYFSIALILYGREYCPARKHDIQQCFLGGHEKKNKEL